MSRLSLLELEQGAGGKIIGFQGGRGLKNKLLARGLRPGKEIKKVSQAFMGGPVTIKVDHSQVALGHGMASRVFVEVYEEVKS